MKLVCIMIAFVITTFSLSAFSSSLSIQKKSSQISNEVFNQIDSDIKSSQIKINKQLINSDKSSQLFDEVKTVNTPVVVPNKPTIIESVNSKSEVKEELVNNETIPDVIAEHIEESRVPARVDASYNTTTVEDEFSSELEGL